MGKNSNVDKKYISVSEFAKKWDISERTVRNYCAQGRIKGSFITGKTWNVPANALLPGRKNKRTFSDNPLLNRLKEEKDAQLKNGIYHRVQIDLTYNSNHIEGSRLSHEQTQFIFETNTIGASKNSIQVDDVIEAVNHFHCIDMIIEEAKSTLDEKFIKKLHYTLKSGTSDSRKDWFVVGDYKKLPNEVGGIATCLPENVQKKMQKLLENYHKSKMENIDEIVAFHQAFELIHPFQDGNGRIGRLVMFKECLANNVIPFIIDDDLKWFYYRGLKEWKKEHGYLIDTCLAAQDKFKRILRYFKIETE